MRVGDSAGNRRPVTDSFLVVAADPSSSIRIGVCSLGVHDVVRIATDLQASYIC